MIAATDKIQDLASQVEVLLPSSSEYEARRQNVWNNIEAHLTPPIAIPKTAEEVAIVVKHAVKTGISLTVRSGGMDFYNRAFEPNAICVDMRALDSVTVSPDRQTATVGGGIIMKDLIEKLADENLMTPGGNAWIVGYVGWATIGGYGPLTNKYGMGFEQIVGAQVVTADGEIVDADPDMLEGIRGMGGNLGVVTSLTIKVYPFIKLLVGMLMFESSNLAETARAYEAAMAKFHIPKELSLHVFIGNIQQPMFGVTFSWADPDHDKGKAVLDAMLAATSKVTMNTVSSKTIMEHHLAFNPPHPTFGSQRSAYISELSPGVLDTLLTALETLPSQTGNMSWTDTILPSHNGAVANTFGVGRHQLLTYSSFTFVESKFAAAQAWSEKLHKTLTTSDDAALLGGGYPSLTPPGDRTSKQIFGDKWERVKELKRKYDPTGVFKYAVPTVDLAE